MSWRRVAAIYAVLALLVGWVVVFEHDAPAPETASVDPKAPSQSLLGADASAVTGIRFTRRGHVIRAERAGDDGARLGAGAPVEPEPSRWRAVEPRGVKVSPDLIEATVATLTAGQPSELLSHEAQDDLAAYGLDAPTASVDIVLRNAPERPITVLIGARNPTQTAVYARRTDQPAIFLVGLNLSYYIDLIFDGASG